VIAAGTSELSIVRRCELLGLRRSSYYYEPLPESAENLELMRRIDRQYMRTPFFGSPKMTAWLRQETDEAVNHKRVARLMRLMGLQAAVPGPHTSRKHPAHPVYPYLLRGLEITHPNQVWSTDITYIPMVYGFLYLVAIIDWFSRYVLSWRLSNTLDTGFCLEALDEALKQGRPEIFNTDQGAQFTSEDFTKAVKDAGMKISMDGRGRALDNVFVERLWRTVKYEEVYPGDYGDGREAYAGLARYFPFYNLERPHQSLGYRTPYEVHTA